MTAQDHGTAEQAAPTKLGHFLTTPKAPATPPVDDIISTARKMIYELDPRQLQIDWSDPAPSVPEPPEVALPPRDPEPPEIRGQTFCSYLAREFMAKQGFKVARMPEIRGLASTCDAVLFHSDGYALTLLCMVDREAYPDEIFRLDVDEVRRIGAACLKYTGTLAGFRMPVLIQIMEIGRGTSAVQQARLKSFQRASLTAKVVPSAVIVDTASRKLWSSERSWFTKAAHQGFIEKRLLARRDVDPDFRPPAILVAQRPWPMVTAVLMMALPAIFAAEISFGIGAPSRLLQPSVTTLLAFGGLTRLGVTQYGEWYRLLSAPWLHLDAVQLAMNVIALGIAGWRLEALFGRAWFGAILVVGALAGALLSLALNPPSYLSVGASGAVLALVAAMLVGSLHFPTGAIRTRLHVRAIVALTAALVPLTGILRGQSVDLTFLLGGAIGGGVIGLGMLAVWPRNEMLPRFRKAAATTALAFVAALAYPAVSVPRNFQAINFITQLIPPDQVPKSSSDMRAHATELIQQYPRDPRPHFLRAVDLLDAHDLTGAEREARQALAEEDLWRSILSPQLGYSLRIMLAAAINGDRPDEARSVAGPACAAIKDGPMRKMLDDQKLCGG